MATGGTKMSANAGLITVETYVQGKIIETSLHKMYNFRLFQGPAWWPSMISLGLSSFPAILPPISMYMKKKLSFSYLGALTSNPRLPNFQGSMTSSQGRHTLIVCITREKNNYQFFIHKPQCETRQLSRPRSPANRFKN